MITNKSYQNNKSTLYLVATPIGNLGDITYRAIEILSSVDFIFCEDTRITQKLLNHLDIKKKLYSYHEHNENIEKDRILNLLSEGHDVALVSDAGTPVISDPGFEVVREAYVEYNVVPIPGASAATMALIVSGLPPKPYTFYGFLDRNKRKRQLQEIRSIRHTMIFYESIHRLDKCLIDLHEVFGDRMIVIAREMTKKFEEFSYGRISEFIENPVTSKGEIVLVVEGNTEEDEITVSVSEHVDIYIEEGLHPTEAIKRVAKERNMRKQDVYNEYHNIH